MKKYLVTVLVGGKEITRLVPAKNERTAKEICSGQNIVSCVPYEGKAANRYIKNEQEFSNIFKTSMMGLTKKKASNEMAVSLPAK